MNNVKLEFTHHYFTCDNWKRKDVAIINNIISKGRLCETMKFLNYGTITFDENDEQHRFPIFNSIEDGKRANALIYKVNSASKPYDRVIIYQTVTKTGGFYGFMTYNTETGKYFHKFFIQRDMYDLMLALNRYFVN